MKFNSKLSIRTKIFSWCSFLIVITLILTSILINTVSESVNIKNALSANKRELALITNNVDATVTHIKDYAISIAVDPRVVSEAKKNPSPPKDETQKYKLKMELNKIIGSIMGLNRNVYMWDLVAANDEFLYVGGYDMSGVESMLSDDYFNQIRTNLGVSISGPYKLKNKGQTVSPVILVSKPVVDLDSREIYGSVVFVIKESSFASIFEKNMPENVESSFYILNENDIVVSSSDKQTISNNINKIGTFTENELKELYENENLSKKVNGQEMLYTISKGLIDTVDWTVISCQSLDSLMVGQKILNQWILLIGTLACLLALFISYIISRSLSRPIMELASSIHDAAQGNLDKKINRHYDGEIGILYEGFNNLMNTVNRLLKRIYKEQEEKNEYQFHLIQAQIKPHFLYNTLEMIKSLIDIGMGETASNCISSMASFYRLSLNRGNDITFVSDEIALSEQYMYLQKLRYIEYLDYSFDIPKELSQYQLPKMTLQPILENSIYHGIKEKQQEGIIEVVLREIDDKLYFTITDNGIGMTPETLSKLRDTIEQTQDIEKTQPPKSFGMASINRRLKLLYNDNYSFNIDSEYGKFTKITLIIPKNTTTIVHNEKENEDE